MTRIQNWDVWMAIQQAKKRYFTLQMREKSTNLSRFSICTVKRKEESTKWNIEVRAQLGGKRNQNISICDKGWTQQKNRWRWSKMQTAGKRWRETCCYCQQALWEKGRIVCLSSHLLSPWPKTTQQTGTKTFAVALSTAPFAQIL